jgi:hypothetical protein
VLTRALLGIDTLAVEVHLEHPAGGRRQFDGFEIVLELLEDPLRQTDGSGSVTSGAAILDVDLHIWNLTFSACLNPGLAAS